MDDLLGEDWQAPAKPTNTAATNKTSFAANFSSLRASPQPPLSGTVSPQTISRPSSTVNGSVRPADTFGNLLSLKAQKAGSTLTIQEKHKQLLEERGRNQEQHAQLWDTLGSGRATPEIRRPSPGVPQTLEHEDDVLAAFNKAAPVDNASYYPPPSSSGVSGRNTPVFASSSRAATLETNPFDEDDDPFGLGALPKQSNGYGLAAIPQFRSDEDDILGELSRPVTTRPPQSALSQSRPPAPESSDGSDAEESHAQQTGPLAELMEMGFPVPLGGFYSKRTKSRSRRQKQRLSQGSEVRFTIAGILLAGNAVSRRACQPGCGRKGDRDLRRDESTVSKDVWL
ncbi:auxilin-like clathrin-binding protein required for normal clathrin function [Friedmanniomyces endolithicus]|nr:auxilin-like clathrin-binding protein required for normal clathrin function [Friedmanniomyces endolithicus]